MGFIYRFLDDKGNVLYIGKTENLKKRISNHFTNGHLCEDCYFSCDKIEYLISLSNVENDIQEIQLINKYKPKYNKQYNYDDIINLEYDCSEDWIEYNFDLEKAKFLYISNKKKIINELIEEVHKLKNMQLEIDKRLNYLNNSLKDELNVEIDGINLVRDNDEAEYGEFLSILNFIYKLINSENNDVSIKKSTDNIYFVDIKGLWDLNFKDYSISRNSFLKMCKKVGIFKGDSSQYYKSTRFENGKLIKCYLMNVKEIEFLIREA